MAQLNFTLNFDDLKDALMESNLNAVVKSAMVLILNEYMEKERDEYIQADAYERVNHRRSQRNGYYERDFTMNIGKVSLRVPRTRDGEFAPSIFERYARMDQALVLTLLEMVINGVSTRKVTKVVEELCGQSVSKSFVSNLIEKLDPVVKEWANRPLSLSYYPHLYVDAMYIKVREGDRVVSKAVYIAMALNKQGKREIIGLKVSHQESFVAWQEFLQGLKARGIQSPKLIISDAHEGLKKAIAQEFLGTSWQRCTVHLKRNIFSHLPKKDTQEFRSQVIRIFRATTIDDARQFLDDVQKGYEHDVKYLKALKVLEEGFEDAIQYLSFPLTIHRFINSTNALERVNQEVRRRERVVRVFPNTNSAFRLIGAVLMDIDEQYKWKNPLNRKL